VWTPLGCQVGAMLGSKLLRKGSQKQISKRTCKRAPSWHHLGTKIAPQKQPRWPPRGPCNTDKSLLMIAAYIVEVSFKNGHPTSRWTTHKELQEGFRTQQKRHPM